jgi:hydrogenase maturation protein HypF
MVQGVGFRPFVHRLATELGLAGHVGNDAEGVFLEVEGAAAAIEEFRARLATEAPPLASVFSIEATPMTPSHRPGFSIVESLADGPVRTYVSPDIAVCGDCRDEMEDPANRRWRYPFINCTNCGPRFTITIRVPYDRPNTTMGTFALCPECADEYHDPVDRRFHAQPVACATCGPQLWFEGATGCVRGTDAALAATQGALARGEIVAIKGLGGYHLACDATSEAAVQRLRSRKQRIDKPFAVMVRDLARARALAEVDADEAALLGSPQCPIVLLRRRSDGRVADGVAPQNPRLGVLLPYTPLHHLLFAPVPDASVAVPDVLVMTSGNLTDEPICFDDNDARRRLGAIADAWLVHDRPIHVPCDDSVVQVDAGNEVPLRRSRGHAPLPLRLPFDTRPILATGGELKNAFCLSSGPTAFMSQHIGDMGSLETLSAFERSTQQFRDIYGTVATRVATDAHPGYQTRRWAEDSGLPITYVQHHHAHIASVMAEHGVASDQRVIGIAFDGTGFGPDGTIWGGEVLVAGYDRFERVAHLRTVPLPGGDTAVRRPSRVALAHLWSAGVAWDDDLPPVAATPPHERALLASQFEHDLLLVPTSSMGRLFDAVSSLLGVRHQAAYEAQAAIELEWLATGGVAPDPGYAFTLLDGAFDAAPVVRAMVDDLRQGRAVADIAAGFHLAVARVIALTASQISASHGLHTVGLSGGVFQNMLLARLARRELAAANLVVLTHRMVPPNDGGLALGQMAVAAHVASDGTRA